MPQRKSGLKELRKNHKQRMHNLDIKTDLKKIIKEYKSLVETDAAKAKATLKKVYSKLDKAAKCNLFHKNTVSRKKSNLAKLLEKKTGS